MKRTLTWLSLVALTFGALGFTLSCGSDEATGNSGGANAGGQGGAAGGLLGGNGGSRAGSSGAGGSGTVNAKLGQGCVTDTECAPNLKCITPDATTFSPNGGPAGGLCTIECMDNSTCTALNPGGLCVAYNDTTGYCMEGCDIGTPAVGVTKCHNRNDVACEPFVLGTAERPCTTNANCDVGRGEVCFQEICALFACTPRCGSDADCPAGRFCDPREGLCTGTAPVGKPLGEDCTPPGDSGIQECQGRCVSIGDGAGNSVAAVCSQFCSVGSRCGNNNGGVCLLVIDQAMGIGDIGFCAQICNCNDECGSDTFGCVDFGDPRFEAAFGKKGVCEYPFTADGGMTPTLACGGQGGQAGAGAGGGAGQSGAAGSSGAGGSAGTAGQGGAG